MEKVEETPSTCKCSSSSDAYSVVGENEERFNSSPCLSGGSQETCPASPGRETIADGSGVEPHLQLRTEKISSGRSSSSLSENGKAEINAKVNKLFRHLNPSREPGDPKFPEAWPDLHTSEDESGWDIKKKGSGKIYTSSTAAKGGNMWDSSDLIYSGGSSANADRKKKGKGSGKPIPSKGTANGDGKTHRHGLTDGHSSDDDADCKGKKKGSGKVSTSKGPAKGSGKLHGPELTAAHRLRWYVPTRWSPVHPNTTAAYDEELRHLQTVVVEQIMMHE